MDGATPDTSGKVALVTGSTDGIGRETALGLARQGATVLVHGRDREKGRALTDRIERETDGSAALLLADFADREAVEELAAAIAERYDRLDVLVHNAGATFQERGETDAGIERTFAINHLAPFLLTHRLLSLLDASAHARVITTSSGLHQRATIDFEDLGMKEEYDGLEAYGRSKLANVLFAYELARRLDPASITANAFGPGFVPGTRLNREASRRFRLATGALGRLPDTLLSALPGPVNTIEEGARSPIYLATDPEVKYVSGHHFENRSPVLSAPESYDPHTARRLWEVSAEMVDLPVADRSIGRDGSDPSRLLDRATRALGRS
ncbi:short-chain dehydrogenase [Halobacteriales archaeon QH_8_64_26]|nr:MAG: short-chain dehydrogenase [Halobacteriales archaeon QH_8_64_26]